MSASLPFLPWRRPVVEAGPVRLSARRLYILPTRAGLVYALLLLGLLLGAINYGLSLAYLFTFWFAGLGVVAMFHTQRNLAGLELRPLPTLPVFAGDRAGFALQLVNPGELPRRRIALQVAGQAGEPVDVAAAGESRLRIALPQPLRGWQPAGRLAVHSQAPLGLFHCWSVLELDWGVLVYPAPAADRLPLPFAEGDAGDGDSGGRDGADFSGLRSYRPGDTPRRIAWKAAARGGRELLTKQFVGNRARRVMLSWGQTPERDVEGRLSRLCRWVLDADAAGLAYGLSLPGVTLPPQAGEAQRRRCLEALARYGQ